MKLPGQISIPQEPTARRKVAVTLAIGVGVLALLLVALLGKQRDVAANSPPAEPAPALTVTVTSPERVPWPQVIEASGAIAAWQEAVIGARVSGLPLAEVDVNVGDSVKRGQVLARFDTSMVRAELAEAEARLVEAKAETRQAAVNRDRALMLRQSGALSEQQILQYVTQADTAQAQQGVAEAALQAARIKLDNTRVVAPDDGVISARNATLGQVADAQSGAELFKLIRQGRLEWRGELTPAQMGQIRIGSPVLLALPDGSQAKATIRQLAPALDANLRLGIAYADIEPGSSARASMYVRGRVELAATDALVVPGESVTIRDGRSYVFAVEGNRVKQLPVTTGRRVGHEIEIVQGMNGDERIAVRGAGFLNDGDLVAIAPGSAQG
jgi:RND family efflux transporter MFP subunit